MEKSSESIREYRDPIKPLPRSGNYLVDMLDDELDAIDAQESNEIEAYYEIYERE